MLCRLVLSTHATLGDQQDRRSQNQDGASHVEDRGADAAGGGQGVARAVQNIEGEFIDFAVANLGESQIRSSSVSTFLLGSAPSKLGGIGKAIDIGSNRNDDRLLQQV